MIILKKDVYLLIFLLSLRLFTGNEGQNVVARIIRRALPSFVYLMIRLI